MLIAFIFTTHCLCFVVTDTNCNPTFFGGHNSTEGAASNVSEVVLGVDWKSIVSLVIFLACVLYARFLAQFPAFLFSCFNSCFLHEGKKVKVKVKLFLYSAIYMVDQKQHALQSGKWQLTGKSQCCCSANAAIHCTR